MSAQIPLTSQLSESDPPLKMNSLSIPAAQLISSASHIVPGQLNVTELFFQVPVDYANPEAETLTLFGRLANKHEVSIFLSTEPAPALPLMVYLEGGPGFGNREPQNHPLTSPALERGYQVLYLDHRGTGLSTPVGADMLATKGGVDEQAEYMQLMRADNTVRDCEAVRKYFTKDLPEHKSSWSLFGQSYGGFVATSYLSMHPEGLREVFMTGGLPPVNRTADEVYQATYKKVIERNEAYYKKFPEDVQTVRQIVKYIDEKGPIPLPAGGNLTTPRLLTMGSSFGGHGGLDSVHSALLTLKASLDQFGFFTRASLAPIEEWTSYDNNIIYAVIHEAIYADGPGMATRWAAERVGKSLEPFSWLEATPDADPLHFSGEMVFPFHFETHPELIRLRDVAHKLANYDKWPKLYDVEQLKKNKVPVYAAVYIEDIYVDYRYSKDTAKIIKGTKTFETNLMYHSALRQKSDEVLQKLFSLRDDVID